MTCTDAAARERMNRVQRDLESFFPTFLTIRRHTFRSVVLRFKEHPEGVGMMLSAARDRDLDVVYCESSIFYPGGAIGSYEGMPDVLYSLEETLTEIYRFYFLMYCVPKIGRKSHLFALLPKRRRPMSLQTMVMTRLSTSDLHDLRQHLCVAWA